MLGAGRGKQGGVWLRYVCALVACWVSPNAYAADGLFGMIEIKANSIRAIPKWVDVLGRIEAEQGRYQACLKNEEACSSSAMRRWSAFVAEQQGQPAREQMEATHRFLNTWTYITDSELWGKSDYWETPREFVDNSGDCEDYAIAKYVTLKALGWPASRLRVAVVQDTVRDIPHAILITSLNDTHWVLDNLALMPLPDRDVMQYKPYYAVNETNRWVFVDPLN
ncbi:MAG: transglutaminase-like cysteine peptidase [Alphaproteobacteria bacterium]